MKPVLWESSAGALNTLLGLQGPLEWADLYTLTLASGTVYRWSGSDLQVSGNSQTWTVGPGLVRGTLRWQVGVQVDTCNVQISDNVGTVIGGLPLMQFIAQRGLDGARMQIDRAFWPFGATVATGALMWFSGRVSAIKDLGRFFANLELTSDLELLNVMVPRDVYQATCLNTLFDSACGLARATYQVNGTASGAGSADKTSFPHVLGQAAGYFDMGVAQFNTGPNAGQVRTIKRHTAGAIVVQRPWPSQAASGNTFSVWPGCDKSQATCTSKFSNVARFRGYPYIPIASTAL